MGIRQLKKMAKVVALTLLLASFGANDESKFLFCESPQKFVFVEAPKVSYPVRNLWWTVNGKYPEKEEMIEHLQTGMHRGKFSVEYLSSLTKQELHSLHSDDHENKVKQLTQTNFEPRKAVQLVVVSTANCGPCRAWEQREQPVFKKFGWKFGPSGHVYKVSKHPEARSYPTFLLVKNGKTVQKFVGYRSANVLMAAYNKLFQAM